MKRGVAQKYSRAAKNDFRFVQLGQAIAGCRAIKCGDPPRQVPTGRAACRCRPCSVVRALAVVLVVPPVLDHDDIAIPVMPTQVPIPVSLTHDAIPVSITHDSDTASTDFDAFRDNHRLVGNDRGTGERRGGQERDGK
jgi:hypothetical protein